jgi:hypothetical protein
MKLGLSADKRLEDAQRRIQFMFSGYLATGVASFFILRPPIWLFGVVILAGWIGGWCLFKLPKMPFMSASWLLYFGVFIVCLIGTQSRTFHRLLPSDYGLVTADFWKALVFHLFSFATGLCGYSLLKIRELRRRAVAQQVASQGEGHSSDALSNQ